MLDLLLSGGVFAALTCRQTSEDNASEKKEKIRSPPASEACLVSKIIRYRRGGQVEPLKINHASLDDRLPN